MLFCSRVVLCCTRVVLVLSHVALALRCVMLYRVVQVLSRVVLVLCHVALVVCLIVSCCVVLYSCCLVLCRVFSCRYSCSFLGQIRGSCRFNTYSIRIGDLDCCRCQKQALQVFFQKKNLFKISRNFQKTSVPEETSVNFANFLRTPFLQDNSKQLLLGVDIAITKLKIQCFS